MGKGQKEILEKREGRRAEEKGEEEKEGGGAERAFQSVVLMVTTCKQSTVCVTVPDPL